MLMILTQGGLEGSEGAIPILIKILYHFLATDEVNFCISAKDQDCPQNVHLRAFFMPLALEQ